MDDATDQSLTLPSALADVAGALAGRYTIRSRLGRGAMKEVYLAYDTRLDREVALAIVVGTSDAAAARARFEREAKVTGRLGDHPNIITIYDTGEHDGVAYLVMRVMAGGSLADEIRRARPSIERTIALGREIALALEHAHAHGVVHRDVKPDNVWLAADGSAALGDFGIARQTGLDRLTADGVVLGTVRYLSPEQIRGADVGPASDLYALGVTLYELATGRAPFEGKDATSVLTQHLTAPPPPPSEHAPEVPGVLERLILDLLAKAPEDRPPSAAATADALAAMRSSAGARPARPATSAPRATDARRLVAVLAAGADVDDPEALHALFHRASTTIERHGGTVERYLGDALVGFFGLTSSHDDDALRAARAAVELRAAEPALRLGIESGELFLGMDPRGTTIATGTTIKAAGRLAEAAAAGEIRLGQSIRQAVAREATVDEQSGRLIELHVDEPALLRPAATPFVGRSAELAALQAAFDVACDERSCRLVTVAGAPGLGKSRLAGEFLAAVSDDATVLAGRCLSYGEGTTYRALWDIVRGLGDDPRRRVMELLPGDDQAVRGVLGAVGLSDEPAQVEETSWGLRRLLERLARERPLVVAVEDIHWAQPPLLDVLDHVVALSSGAPILLVCLTRPELLDSRPAWAAPQPNRSVVVLDALDEAQALELAKRLGAGEHARRIAGRAEGNPLFVEQLVAVGADMGTGELPASIQGVLAARIDRLEPGERDLLRRASVEGRTFHAGALAASLPAAGQRGVGALLVGLARKGLIGADRAEFEGEDAFRFTHVLIRDAAYAGVPKLMRAELHAVVAKWLAPRRAADEIVGYHLEQAYVLATELRTAGEREHALAKQAAGHFERAARAALARADPAAASALLERAIALVEHDDDERGALLPALGASLFDAGRITEATRVLDEAIARTPDPRLHARARIEREFVRLETEATSHTDEVQRVTEDVLPVLEDVADEHGQSRVWMLRGQLAWLAGQVQRADDAWREAADRAGRAGHERDMFDAMGWRATAAALGPAHVDDAIRRCEAFRANAGSSPVAVMWMLNPLAQLHAMKGELDVAESFMHEANATRRKLGNITSLASHHEASIRLLTDQPELAEACLRASVDQLGAVGDAGMLSTTTAMLAQAVYAQGRSDEAGELCLQTAQTAAEDDIITRVIWRSVQAKVLARAGRTEEAVALAREAVALIAATDLLSHHGDAMLDLAEVLSLCGSAEEAAEAGRSALSLYEAKGNMAAAARAHALLGNGPAG